MKKISILIIVSLCFNIMSAMAQAEEKVEVYEKEHVKDKSPIPYVAIREADVVWSKTIWRMIDLRHKKNLSLYYPSTPIGQRMSLIDLVLYGVKNEGLNVYEDPEMSDATTEFELLMTPEAVDLAMDALPDTIQVDDGSGNMVQEVTKGAAKTRQVLQVLVKEKWYFDRQHSVMNVRVVGFCPIRVYTKDDSPDLVRKKTFWVYYPEVRGLFANHEVYNRNNDAQRISFDDFFMQRRFDSFIYAESNVYNDRMVSEYTSGMHQMLESERVEGELFRMEHDMWVY